MDIIDANGSRATIGLLAFAHAKLAPPVKWISGQPHNLEEYLHFPTIEIDADMPENEIRMIDPASGRTLAIIRNVGTLEAA